MVFVILFSFNTQAQKETKISDERIEDLSEKICSAALIFRTVNAEEAGKDLELMILNFIGITKEDPNYKDKLTEFWNDNTEKIICYDEGSTKYTRTPQHFLKRIVDLGIHKSVFNYFLLYNPYKLPLDVIAIEIYNGKEETLLNYLNAILANPDNQEKYIMQEIESLRRLLLMGYNAKTASEL